MFDDDGKIQATLLSVNYNLELLGDQFSNHMPKDNKKDFEKKVEDIRKEVFHILDVTKKVNQVIEREYR